MGAQGAKPKLLDCQGMMEGEKRRLRIPPTEAYGTQGFPAWKIPPEATIEFEIECLKIHAIPPPADLVPHPKDEMYKKDSALKKSASGVSSSSLPVPSSMDTQILSG